MPNITTPSRTGTYGPTSLKISGKMNPSIPNVITHRANVLFTNWLTFTRYFISSIEACVIGASPSKKL